MSKKTPAGSLYTTGHRNEGKIVTVVVPTDCATASAVCGCCPPRSHTCVFSFFTPQLSHWPSCSRAILGKGDRRTRSAGEELGEEDLPRRDRPPQPRPRRWDPTAIGLDLVAREEAEVESRARGGGPRGGGRARQPRRRTPPPGEQAGGHGAPASHAVLLDSSQCIRRRRI